jgi:hypothetical protein
MRKLFLLAVMALAALAVMAPSAFALDYPHGDSNMENWESVAVVQDGSPCYDPCGFASEDDVNWQTEHPWTGGPNVSSNCYGRLGGSFDYWGGVSVSDPVLYETGGNHWSAAFCNSVDTAQEDYWVGTACRHEPTGEVWVLHELVFEQRYGSGPYYAGMTFARVVGVPNGDDGLDATSIRYGGGTSGEFAEIDGNLTPWSHRADFELDESTDISFNPGGDGCAF